MQQNSARARLPKQHAHMHTLTHTRTLTLTYSSRIKNHRSSSASRGMIHIVSKSEVTFFQPLTRLLGTAHPSGRSNIFSKLAARRFRHLTLRFRSYSRSSTASS